jgi:hypothetical protein
LSLFSGCSRSSARSSRFLFPGGPFAACLRTALRIALRRGLSRVFPELVGRRGPASLLRRGLSGAGVRCVWLRRLCRLYDGLCRLLSQFGGRRRLICARRRHNQRCAQHRQYLLHHEETLRKHRVEVNHRNRSK